MNARIKALCLIFERTSKGNGILSAAIRLPAAIGGPNFGDRSSFLGIPNRPTRVTVESVAWFDNTPVTAC